MEPIMIDIGGKRPRKPPIKCCGCREDHMFRDCPLKGEKVRIVHCIHQAKIVEDMGKSVPRIYTSLDNKQDDFQSHMIEVEANYIS
jgi:hypothetical protein